MVGTPASLMCAAACAALSACIPLSDRNSCRKNTDCAADEVCTDVRECGGAEDAPAWRIAWTVNQSLPTADNCALIAELALTISSPTEMLTYEPLACAVGSFGFVALPLAYNTARLDAIEATGGTIATARESQTREAGSELILDLSF